MKENFEKIYEGVSVFKNKNSINRKQYNIALNEDLMKKINKIQQALQLKLDQYVGRAEILEIILKRGLNSLDAAVGIDDDIYTFKELEQLYQWVFNDYYNSIKEYLININEFENIINQVNDYISLDLNNDIPLKIKILTKQNGNITLDIEHLDIENLDKSVITFFSNSLYDTFVLKGNEYYLLRNRKYIDNIIPIEDSIKVALHFYREIKFKKNKYTELQKIIKDKNKNIDEFDIYKIIIDSSICYTKSLYSAEFDLNKNVEFEENNEAIDEKIISNIKLDKKMYKFREKTFEENSLLNNKLFQYCLKHKIQKYENEFNIK